MNGQFKMPAGIRWSGHLVATVLVCIIALVFVVRDGFPLLLAVVRPSAAVETVDVTTPLLTKHSEVHTLNQKRLENRYLFSMPPNWKRKAPPRRPDPPPRTEPIVPPAPPPPPAEYTGPRPIGMFGSSVYFEGGRTIDLGKESDGVTVVEIVSAWKLKLKHKGKVYEVAFGERAPENLFTPAPPKMTVPGITEGARESATRLTVAGSPGRPANASPQAGATPTTPPPTTPPASTAPAEGGAAGVQAAHATGPGAATLPPALTEEAINAMTRDQVREALRAVTQAQATPDLDEPTQSRLKRELELLGARLTER